MQQVRTIQHHNLNRAINNRLPVHTLTLAVWLVALQYLDYYQKLQLYIFRDDTISLLKEALGL